MRRNLELHQGLCQSPGCGSPAVEADHIIPVAEGGTYRLSNGQGLCVGHHKAKTQAEAARGRARLPKFHQTRAKESPPGLLP